MEDGKWLIIHLKFDDKVGEKTGKGERRKGSVKKRVHDT